MSYPFSFGPCIDYTSTKVSELQLQRVLGALHKENFLAWTNMPGAEK